MKSNKGFIISTTLYSAFGIMMITVATILYLMSNNMLMNMTSIESLKESLEKTNEENPDDPVAGDETPNPPICDNIGDKTQYSDSSGANIPILSDGMIAVTYDEQKDVWVKADISNKWYDYDQQWWANAVTVKSGSRNTYLCAVPGTTVSMSDINSMWVWIPRYKYKISTNSIDVKFINKSDYDSISELKYREDLKNGKLASGYYVHPSFRNANNISYDSNYKSRGAWDRELSGYWVGKFLTGGTSNNPVIIPNVRSLSLSNEPDISGQFVTSLKFAGGEINKFSGVVTFNGSTTYGLTSDNDSHMMKSTEFGAVAILSKSKYGNPNPIFCNDSGASTDYTGISSGKIINDRNYYNSPGSYSYNGKSCSTKYCNGISWDKADPTIKNYCSEFSCAGNKDSTKGTGASSTGNIYGIYDLFGPNELVMGKLNGYNGFWINANNISSIPAGFNGKYIIYEKGKSTVFEKNTGINLPISKYIDLYSNPDNSEIINLDFTILGDATYEMQQFLGSSNRKFQRALTISEQPSDATNTGAWFTRGGDFYECYSPYNIFTTCYYNQDNIIVAWEQLYFNKAFHNVLIPGDS